MASALIVFACATALSAGCRGRAQSESKACREGSALSTAMYRGTDLPPKTLALTFDDGPGERTIELSHFLKQEGIPAGFFVNGRMVTNREAVLQELVADGHVIGNHTQTHPHLTTLGPSQIVAEVEETDKLIAPFVPDGRFMFRPPFGEYDDDTFASLANSSMKKYVGPIDWDIGSMMGPGRAADWDCWSPTGSSQPSVLDVKTCGDLYLQEIRRVSSGIVLLHDPHFIDSDPTKGGTVDMIEYIVPILKAEGFRFVRVDEVPSIDSELPPLTRPKSEPPPVVVPSASSTASSPPPAPGASAAPDQPGNTAGGDSSDPCRRSPQTRPANSGESGHL